jgi:hypothetical protein
MGRMALLALRLVLPAIAFGALLLIRKAVNPSPAIWARALKVGWVAGLLNLAADTIAGWAGLWHYMMQGLIFGLPLDLYIAVALVYGSGVALIYDWLRRKHPQFRLWFAGLLPVYGVIRDHVGTWVAPQVFLVWDSPSWWVFDFVSWVLSLWTMLYLFRRAGKSVR